MRTLIFFRGHSFLTVVLFSTSLLAQTYNGGPVVGQPKVVQVLWNSSATLPVDSNGEGQVSGMLRIFTASMNWFGPDYSTLATSLQPATTIVNGSFVPGAGAHASANGGWKITPMNPNVTLTDLDIQRELVSQLQAGNLPVDLTSCNNVASPPYCNTTYLYLVQLPPGIVVSNPSGTLECTAPSNLCGYHWSISSPRPQVAGVSVAVRYSVLVDYTSQSTHCYPVCAVAGTSSMEDALTVVQSHELSELITDPDLNAWQPEIGDSPCNTQSGALGAYSVQYEWSRTRSRCYLQTCSSGLTACGDLCVNTQTDFNNCGGCGLTCSSLSSNATSMTCSAGACCAQSCAAGYTLCGCNCVNTNTDPNNCGGCGPSTSCFGGPPATYCSNGNCICPPPMFTCCGGDVCASPGTNCPRQCP